MCLWRCQFCYLSRMFGTLLMPDIQREQVSEIISLTEAEARGYPMIDIRARFRNFPTTLRANPTETREYEMTQNHPISVVCGSCTCSWQDWRQAIEITNGPAPLVPSALCNIAARSCNSFHFTSLLTVSYSCPSTWHHFFVYAFIVICNICLQFNNI